MGRRLTTYYYFANRRFVNATLRKSSLWGNIAAMNLPALYNLTKRLSGAAIKSNSFNLTIPVPVQGRP